MSSVVTTKSHSLQDPFLNALRRQRVPVNIYLTNGIKLQGHVAAFDQYVVLLKNNTKQMVFKHAVATIVPSRNVIWHLFHFILLFFVGYFFLGEKLTKNQIIATLFAFVSLFLFMRDGNHHH